MRFVSTLSELFTKAHYQIHQYSNRPFAQHLSPSSRALRNRHDASSIIRTLSSTAISILYKMENRTKHTREGAFELSEEEILDSPRKPPSEGQGDDTRFPHNVDSASSLAIQRHQENKASVQSSHAASSGPVNGVKRRVEGAVLGIPSPGLVSSQSKGTEDNTDSE